MLVSASDRDFTDSFGEASALAKALAKQREAGASELVRELAGTHGTGFGLVPSPKEVLSDTIAALGSSMEILAAKAPDEAANYRQLVLETSQAVAEAKGGGVSDQEAAALEQIRAALGDA
jgi:hypothetical protein